MGSMPYPGTIQDRTFNLFSILADQRLSANALFWITAMDPGPRTFGRGSGAEFRGSSFVARASWTPKRVTWAGCKIWIELGRGGGRILGVLAARTEDGGGWAEAVARKTLG